MPITQNLLSPQDREILAAATTQLRPDQPDCFDYTQLATACNLTRHMVVAAFPFPELLAVGIVVLEWEKESGSSFSRPKKWILDSMDWDPDPELLAHFDGHPIVQAFLRAKPMLDDHRNLISFVSYNIR